MWLSQFETLRIEFRKPTLLWMKRWNGFVCFADVNKPYAFRCAERNKKQRFYENVSFLTLSLMLTEDPIHTHTYHIYCKSIIIATSDHCQPIIAFFFLLLLRFDLCSRVVICNMLVGLFFFSSRFGFVCLRTHGAIYLIYDLIEATQCLCVNYVIWRCGFDFVSIMFP